VKKLVLMVSIYNSGEWIANRLKNLLSSSVADQIEIWCINADSPDERDHKVCLDFANRHQQIKYERLAKRNTVYEAWNYIIQNSDSQYIANANTDDLVAPNCYEVLMGTLDGDLGMGLAYCSWYTTGKANQNWNKLVAASDDGKPGQYGGDIDTAGVGHFPLWRRSLHDEIGLFDARFQALADADWWARIHFVAKKRCHWVRQTLGLYLWRSGQNLWHQKVNAEEWQLYHKKMALYKQGKLE
jgi:glycosyltransferase involved in cell wall biosynthesis